jgi:rare lipoprotein A
MNRCMQLGALAAMAGMAGLIGGCASSVSPGADGARAKPEGVPTQVLTLHQRAADQQPETAPGTATTPGAYYQDDGPAANPPPDLDKVPDAEPRVEPFNKYANRPYVVRGKRYVPQTDGAAFSERGQGSWYGKKFHGQRTASGEIYDMFKMSAAHPTLPIPSYARVTGVKSGKSVVVRVNDRGPFHKGRVVDVSYAAAVRLGLVSAGSIEVSVERLMPADIAALANGSQGGERAEAAVADSFFLQLGAFARADAADALRQRMLELDVDGERMKVERSGRRHRLLIGPYPSRADADDAALTLPEVLALKPVVVKR